jgi:hypothetical protein
MATDFTTLVDRALLAAEGVPAVWTGTRGAKPVTVIPPLASSGPEGDGEFQVVVREIKASGLERDLIDVKPGDALTVGGRDYRVLYQDADETGWIDLYLERV